MTIGEDQQEDEYYYISEELDHEVDQCFEESYTSVYIPIQCLLELYEKYTDPQDREYLRDQITYVIDYLLDDCLRLYGVFRQYCEEIMYEMLTSTFKTQLEKIIDLEERVNKLLRNAKYIGKRKYGKYRLM